MFALGLVILEAATLRSSEDVYDVKEFRIREERIYERIYFVSAYYSPEITHTLRLMLETDSRVRPDFLALEKLLS